MNKFYEDVKSKALASYRALAKEYAPFEDANMLLGAAEKTVALSRSKTVKTVDTEWITKIDDAIEQKLEELDNEDEEEDYSSEQPSKRFKKQR